MSLPVIEVSGLSKRYRLGAIGPLSLRETVNRWVDRARRRAPAPEKGEFWALRDVGFSIQPGEVVGIVGRNGAGKSTLLKILSRITEPTSGRAVIRGRVASLLEVGTGFHPELSGRENIYLNGAILGMTRVDIAKKFDEMVAFAEVDAFIDTPVKRYSSGMYVRLAFAVAAHLEPDVLIVDEVLAVGDAVFQKKCLGKMKDVSRNHGRTVLFVSHNMAALSSLCSRAILLQEGRLSADGPTAAVLTAYVRGSASGVSSRSWKDPSCAPGNAHIRLRSVEVSSPDPEGILSVDTGARIVIEFLNQRSGINLDCTTYVTNAEGILVFESGCIVSADADSKVGRYRVTADLPPHLLNAGRYTMSLGFGQDQRHVLCRIDDVASFEVENTSTGRGANMYLAAGVVRPLLGWRYEFFPL